MADVPKRVGDERDRRTDNEREDRARARTSDETIAEAGREGRAAAREILTSIRTQLEEKRRRA